MRHLKYKKIFEDQSDDIGIRGVVIDSIDKITGFTSDKYVIKGHKNGELCFTVINSKGSVKFYPNEESFLQRDSNPSNLEG